MSSSRDNELIVVEKEIPDADGWTVGMIATTDKNGDRFLAVMVRDRFAIYQIATYSHKLGLESIGVKGGLVHPLDLRSLIFKKIGNFEKDPDIEFWTKFFESLYGILAVVSVLES